MIEDELYEFERKRRERDTSSEVRAPSKAEDATMKHAPSTAAELPAVQEKFSEKNLTEEPFVSNLITAQPNEAMKDAAPELQSHHDEAMEEEPACAGAEVDTKPEEGEQSKVDKDVNVNANVNKQASHKEEEAEAAEEAKGKDENARLQAKKEAQAEADMIDEHHGETIVEAEEDTVIY